MSGSIQIIAEIGQAHDGSLGILHSYIDALSKTGVDIVKFQTHIAEAESSVHEPFRIPFSYADKTRFDYWKRMELSREDWMNVKRHCETAGMVFMSSPFSNTAVDLLESIGVDQYKIGSGEVSNHLLLEKIAQTGKSVVLSSGMSGYEELDAAVNIFRRLGNALSLMQCTSQYPVKPESLGLNVISELRERYHLPVGLSDHSGEIYPSMAAVALGASLLEVHAVFDKRMFGPDASSSLTMDQLTELVKGVRFIESSLRHPVDKNDVSAFSQMRVIFGKGLAVNRSLKAGYRLKFEDLEAKKPADRGIPASRFREVIGRKLMKDKGKYEFIKKEDIE